MTPGKLETIKPICSDTSLIEGDCFPSIVLGFVTNFVALPGVKAKVVVTDIQNKTQESDYLTWFKNRFLLVQKEPTISQKVGGGSNISVTICKSASLKV